MTVDRCSAETQPLPNFSASEAARSWLAALPQAPALRADRTPASMATTTELPVFRAAVAL